MKTYLLTILLLGFIATPAWAGLTVTDKHPTIGKVTTVKVTNKQKLPVEKAQLVVTYYPNSKLTREVLLKETTDTGGMLQWKPTSPGIVLLTARIPDGKDKKGKPKYKIVASTSVSVRFPGMPTAGLMVFLLAGSLLFGGMFFGFYRAFKSEQE